jgi:hypothetical protein
MVYLVIGYNDAKQEYVDAIFHERSDANEHKEWCENQMPGSKYCVDERHVR